MQVSSLPHELTLVRYFINDRAEEEMSGDQINRGQKEIKLPGTDIPIGFLQVGCKNI